MKISELLNKKAVKNAPTIMSATEKNGNINRTKANKMVDPFGYFKRNKHKKK